MIYAFALCKSMPPPAPRLLLIVVAFRSPCWFDWDAQIATMLGVANMRVYEVATFYSMFNRNPVCARRLPSCGCNVIRRLRDPSMSH
eukprot:1192270-Prorocentrum_minimum.AAC.8